MNKKAIRFIAAAAMTAVLAMPVAAHAAGEAAPAPKAGANNLSVTLNTEGAFTALEINNQVRVFDKNGQLFKTEGADRVGKLKDLFILPYGPQQVPFILVENKKNGYLVFSDLWPEFSKGKESDTEEAYYSGKIFGSAVKKMYSKTKHHYAEMQGNEAVAFTANDFGDLSKGYHESIRVEGKLRGLILYDCCPFLVVEDENKKLVVYHAGETGAEQAGSIVLN